MWHHFDYERAAEMRKRYIPVEKVLGAVNPAPSDVIMDIGGGDGHYSLIFARECRKVIYVDPSSHAAELTRKNSRNSNGKIEIMQADVCSMELPDDVNKVFFSNSFHDISCRENLVRRFAEKKKGLNLILVEFRKDADIGPPEFIKIGQDELDAIFLQNGYRLLKRELLEKHYISVYSS